MAMQFYNYKNFGSTWLADANSYRFAESYLAAVEAHKRAKKPTTKPKKEEASDEAIDFPELDNQ